MVLEPAPCVSVATTSPAHECVTSRCTSASSTISGVGGTVIVLTVGGPGTLVPLPSAIGSGVSVDGYVFTTGPPGPTVKSMHQSAIVPTSPAASSSPQRSHAPLGSSPSNTDSRVFDVGTGAGGS